MLTVTSLQIHHDRAVEAVREVSPDAVAADPAVSAACPGEGEGLPDPHQLLAVDPKGLHRCTQALLRSWTDAQAEGRSAQMLLDLDAPTAVLGAPR